MIISWQKIDGCCKDLIRWKMIFWIWLKCIWFFSWSNMISSPFKVKLYLSFNLTVDNFDADKVDIISTIIIRNVSWANHFSTFRRNTAHHYWMTTLFVTVTIIFQDDEEIDIVKFQTYIYRGNWNLFMEQHFIINKHVITWLLLSCYWASGNDH